MAKLDISRSMNFALVRFKSHRDFRQALND